MNEDRMQSADLLNQAQNVHTAEDDAMRRLKELIRIQKSMGHSFTVLDGDFNDISTKFNDVTSLLENPVCIAHWSQDAYIGLKSETQWIRVRIRSGRVRDVTFLLEMKFHGIVIVNPSTDGFQWLAVGYSPHDGDKPDGIAVISRADYRASRITRCFPLLEGQTSVDSKEKGKLICYRISKCLKLPQITKTRYIPENHGFFKNPAGKYDFCSSRVLSTGIGSFLSNAVLRREFPEISFQPGNDCTAIVKANFADRPKCKLLFNVRFASMNQFLFAKYDVYNDNVIQVKGNVDFPRAILLNTRYSSLEAPAVGPNITALRFDLGCINDGIVLAIDPFKSDQIHKAERGYDLLINDVSAASENQAGVHHITVLLSDFADLYIPADKRCVLNFDDNMNGRLVANIRSVMRMFDTDSILKIVHECNDGNYLSRFQHHIWDVRSSIPDSIPPSKRNLYILLVTSQRIYNELYSPYFDTESEEFVVKWLSSQEQDQLSMDDRICSEYARKLNMRLSDGYYHLVLKDDVTEFEKDTHSVIVDPEEHRLFIEPAESFVIAREMQSISDTDSLTGALYRCDYIPHNPRDEKSVRIKTRSPLDGPHPVYFHALDYSLVTPDNLLRLDLIDKESFLFRCDEFPPEGFLPLIKTVDGRFAGVKLDFEYSASHHYFGTGRSGSGKSWAIAQLLCMLLMLGCHVVVFDVSGTYTEKELRRMLPGKVVDKLFRFIRVGVGKDQIPVNIGSLRNCTSLPDKKKAAFNVLNAALGQLDREKAVDAEQKKSLMGFLSRYLKNKTGQVDFKEMLAAMRSDHSLGSKIVPALESVLTDISEIGCADSSWGDMFGNKDKIHIIDLGTEVGESTHQLLDILVSSLLAWQIKHDNKYLFVSVDELADQYFSKNSPLYTVMIHGRKFHTAFIGATQEYFNPGAPYMDVLKQAPIKSFGRPGKSADRIAKMHGFANAFDAGFHRFKVGDIIMELDAYNKQTEDSDSVTLRGRVVDFVETPFYERFLHEYANQDDEERGERQ